NPYLILRTDLLYPLSYEGALFAIPTHSTFKSDLLQAPGLKYLGEQSFTLFTVIPRKVFMHR
ncbi:MAG: hypothetical protein AAB467_00800, partial [Patescibacteria group bacterium]